VIISAGTMQSPLILKRSGLKNAHIGKHLKLHPVNFVGAVYEEEVRPWEGGILTAVVSEFENMDGKGHGVKLESTSMLPAFWLTALLWRGGLEYKLLAPRMSHMIGHFAMVRDTGEGEVYADPIDGRSRFRYHPSKKDKQHILDGMLSCAKINYIEGAKEIFCLIPGMSNFVRPDTGCESKGINCSHFNAWLDEVKKNGFPNPESFFVSAHQMGTCRMGKSAEHGVVDQKGKVWETEGLYVADASVFPSASGVNPMVTNMAIADWISINLAKDLKTGGSEKAKL
jgi:choline dehydrogenase-like flavoprotein